MAAGPAQVRDQPPRPQSWGNSAADCAPFDLSPSERPLRILVVYDCIYPWSIGGAERWYRALAERLAISGHDVTYLTLRQWEPRSFQGPLLGPTAVLKAVARRWNRLVLSPERPSPKGTRRSARNLFQGAPNATTGCANSSERGSNATNAPQIPGVRIVGAGPNLLLYTGTRRRLWPPLRFGLGVLAHLLRHGRGYDVVHTASFPYWPLLAATLLRPLGRYRIVIDWWEVWTRRYWLAYAGLGAGMIGWAVQRACVRLSRRVFCFSHLHARRLRAEGFRGSLTLLRGIYDGPKQGIIPDLTPAPIVLYAGRHIPEKRLSAIIPALVLARQTAPELQAVIAGDGPERPLLRQAVVMAGFDAVIDLPGFVDEQALEELFHHALCLILPSRREGYGLVVVEAAAHGTPSVVVRGPDNAATELIEEGVNGFIATSAAAPDLASAILRVYAAGPALRRSTVAWFARNADRLSLSSSLDQVSAAYRDEQRTA